MKVVLSHPTGNQFVRALISALAEQNRLSEFHTALAIGPDQPLLRFLPENLRRELLRRSFPVSSSLIHTHPLREISRLFLPKLGFAGAVKHETGFASVDAVYRNIDKAVAARLSKLKRKDDVTAVYAYDDGAESSFKIAKELGLTCFYDLPIGHWRASKIMLEAERERWPDWAATITGLQDSPAKLDRKDNELRLADTIFVASSFTAKTLEHFPGRLAPVKIVPYGFPPVAGHKNYDVKLSYNRPLKLLFVGGLSQRKGIADLFAAVSIFGNRVDLTVVGQKPVEDCRVLNDELNKHTWIPSLPHNGILALMRSADVLIFPSLFEGFGLVITEAMAQGTPVVTTERTAGPELINDGENGWLINAGATEALCSAIENILVKPAVIQHAGLAAMQTAQKRPWEVYGQEMLAAITADK